MANPPTTNYGFTLPVVGGDTDAWGGELNTNWTNIDGYLHTVSGVANAALPQAGGTLTGPVTGTSATFSGAITAASISAPQAIGDNRLINGDMRICQRASSGTVNSYTVDRWTYSGSQASKGTWAQSGGPSTVAGAGFSKSLSFTSSSAYTPLATDSFGFWQAIEADMITDFMWGSSVAQTVILSFWVYSSLTGTFGGAVQNYAETRCYPFSYSIPTANTWAKVVITIPGDIAGTWVMSGNAGALYLVFDLGSGANFRGPANAWATTTSTTAYQSVTGAQSIVATNGSVIQITGVKLEVGSVATPYNRQSLTKSMADCQRYYQTGNVQMAAYAQSAGLNNVLALPFPVLMRATPTLTPNFTTQSNATGSISGLSNFGIQLNANATAAGNFNIAGTWTASAEL